jgi:ribonucleoside-diphosphate reductase alpha chain
MKQFRPEGFSEQIFKDRYAFTESETWEEACQRVARQMASAETSEKVEKYQEKFNEILVNNFFVPGGRIWYNSGRPNPQLLNCFVLGNELDSKEGWAKISYENIVTSMTGGGCGQDFSDVRPNGATISGHRGICPGPVELMRLVNHNGKSVRAGGGRRVANMFSLDGEHPDLLEFLDAKLVKGELDMANVSVRMRNTTKFIEAVKNDLDWELSWKGQYKKKIRARELWDKIVKNAYDSAEPGFLNMELALNESNIWYVEDLVTTNPCGEIFLSPYDCCCLGHLVLTRFVKDSEVDWHLLAEVIRNAVRFLDNVLSVNSFPLPEMKAKSNRLRRIGLGTTALADMLILLGVKYGSKEGNEFIDKLYRFISKAAYEASVMLAIEKGPFPACKPDKHVESGFMKRMPKKIRGLVKEHGIRNCAILTQAPTGTVSILSGNCSAAIEPIFGFAYWRNYWDGEVRKRELCFHPLFKQFLDEGKDVRHFVAARELSIRDHMEVQKIVQSHMDNAVSKTINIAKEFADITKMSELWLEYLPSLKGTTFYREGSRNYVDSNGVEHEPPLVEIPLDEALKLYKEEKEKITINKEEELDCATGICEIPNDRKKD